MHHAATSLIVMSSVACAASAESIVYELVDVWLDPDVSQPWTDPQPMFGTVTWTYDAGDFENGTGVMTNLDIPWWLEGTDPTLSSTIEPEQIEITMDGNYHDYGVDIQLKFLAGFADDGGAVIDTAMSAFEIQRGVVYQGHIISGSLVVVPPACAGDFDASGAVDVSDVLAMLSMWDTPDGDLTGDGLTNVDDLLMLLAAWGGCG